MLISELGIKHHVMAYMVAAVIVIFGIIGLYRVGIDEMPAVDFPVIMVHTNLIGADAKIIDKTVTSVMLDNLNGIEGIDTLTGKSFPSSSMVVIVFDLEKDINLAFAEVQAKVSQTLNSLPSEVKSPIIIKASSNDSPILQFTVSGNRSIQQLTDFADNIMKKQLENVSGVSQVSLSGSRTKQIRIDVDVDKLAMYGISSNDIKNQLFVNHIQAPGGYLVGNKKEFLLNLDLEYHDIQSLRNLVIKSINGSLIRLSDVATVTDSLADFRNYYSYNSETAVVLEITNIVGSNSFSIKKEILERVENNILPNLESGVKVSLTYDSVSFIKTLVDNLKEHIYLGVLLTGLIVFVFLRNIIPTIIIGISIPISLLAACLVIYICGYTLNVITLLGLLLLIGIVVDDSIIVLENIYRYLEEGVDSVKAAVEGSRQVAFSVLAATMSLACIFGSVMFLDGILGKFFKSFAVVVTSGVLISYFVSLYITPMLCSRYLKINHQEGFFKRLLNKCLVALENVYQKALFYSLNHRFIIIIISGLILFSISKVNLITEFVPSSDRSTLVVTVNATPGTNIYDTLNYAHQVESIAHKYKEVENISTTIGSSNSSGSTNSAKITLDLLPIKDRILTQKEISQKLTEDFKSIIGANIYISEASSAGGDGYGLTFSLQTTNLDDLKKYSNILAREISTNPYLGGVPKQSMDLLPQLSFTVDRDKLVLLGLSVKDVKDAITSSVAGLTIAQFNTPGGSTRYDVVLKGDANSFKNPEDLLNIYITTSKGFNIRLDSVLNYNYEMGYSTINRKGSLYSNEFNLNPSIPMDAAMKEISKITKKELTSDFSIEYGGNAKQLQKAATGLVSVFILAIVLLYMVLASQFNSFLQPLVLMVPIPLAVVGGVWSLHLTGISLNIFSTIGIILLVGLVAKNSILMIDFTNQLRAQGLSVREALEKACPLRLRPILITSLTVILTMVPSAIANGEGSAINKSLSVVIVGGMISSTFLTLFVIPAVYSLIEGLKARLSNKFKKAIKGN